jgi:dolichyl-phosphate beta-glucosyltransferase
MLHFQALKTSCGTNIDSKRGDHLQTYLIIPCFNEAIRFQREYWEILTHNEKINLIFVNDGSTDETNAILQEFCQNNSATLVSLHKNLGKAGAIRQGFLHSYIEPGSAVGFLDADSAFTLDTVNSFVNSFHLRQNMGYKALWSSRVRLSGRDIERSNFRHYTSRILLTLILNHFSIKVYDTQSGFKIFSKDVLDTVMSEEFLTKWFVDIEILLRYRDAIKSDLSLWEEPVLSWQDVRGSNLKLTSIFSVFFEIYNLVSSYQKNPFNQRSK